MSGINYRQARARLSQKICDKQLDLLRSNMNTYWILLQILHTIKNVVFFSIFTETQIVCSQNFVRNSFATFTIPVVSGIFFENLLKPEPMTHISCFKEACTCVVTMDPNSSSSVGHNTINLKAQCQPNCIAIPPLHYPPFTVSHNFAVFN